MVKTIEDLNPRSVPVVTIRKTVERAITMREMIHEIFEQVGWPEVLFTHPGTLGQQYKTRLKELWGPQWWLHPESNRWSDMVVAWRTGSLDRQIADLAANLPAATRKKLGV